MMDPWEPDDVCKWCKKDIEDCKCDPDDREADYEDAIDWRRRHIRDNDAYWKHNNAVNESRMREH